MTETITQTSGRVAAIYARVSFERQREEGTVQSQLAGLRELAAERQPAADHRGVGVLR